MNTNHIIIGIILVLAVSYLLIFLKNKSPVHIKYEKTNNNNVLKKVVRKTKDYNIYGLPKKDDYMSQLMKEQLNNLQTKFYYDNCRFDVA